MNYNLFSNTKMPHVFMCVHVCVSVCVYITDIIKYTSNDSYFIAPLAGTRGGVGNRLSC
jgi:hypothetical protein